MGDEALILHRRGLLCSAAAVSMVGAAVLRPDGAEARIYHGSLPWTPNSADPPAVVVAGPWQFFTANEAALVEAAVDRLIPEDELGSGGKASGCAVYLDRQLAGPYGHAAGLYMLPPFTNGTPQQGIQTPLTPAEQFRLGLAAVDGHCRAAFLGKTFATLKPEQQDSVLRGLESGSVRLADIDPRKFFALLWENTREGYFADPIYGGNRDMVSWKLIGFPGARYDYRDHILNYGQPYPLPPVGIQGRPDWTKAS